MKTTIYCLLILFCSLWSCTVETLPDEELNIVRQSYLGNELKLDGCYVGEYPWKNKYCSYRFFYNNGVVLFFSDTLNIHDVNHFSCGIDIYRKNKHCWGVFLIQDRKVRVQTWTPKLDYSVIQNIIYDDYYTILNDTTISQSLSNNETVYYHLRKFSSKPDSTNLFIK